MFETRLFNILMEEIGENREIWILSTSLNLSYRYAFEKKILRLNFQRLYNVVLTSCADWIFTFQFEALCGFAFPQCTKGFSCQVNLTSDT